MMKKLSVLFFVLAIVLCGCGKTENIQTTVIDDPLYYIEYGDYGYYVYKNHVELKEFSGSSSETVELPSTLYDSEAKKDKPLTVIGKNAFNENTGARNLIIPDSVTEIRSNAFYNCTGIETVTLSKNLKTIGSSAFSECSTIKEITIPDSVKYIADSAFYRCASLSKLTLGSGVTKIGEDAFSGCISLEEISGGDSLKVIGSSAFEKTPWYDNLKDEFAMLGSVLVKYNGSDSKVTLPDDIAAVADAFTGNTDITSVKLPKKLTSIGNSAFEGCTSLEDVNIPDTVAYIGHRAFAETPFLEGLDSDDGYCVVGDGVLLKYTGDNSSIKIPDNVKFISDAFKGNSTLVDIRIGDNTAEIGRDAFADCPEFKTVIMSDSVTHIDEYAFYGTDILEFYTSGNVYTENWAKDYGLSNIITE